MKHRSGWQIAATHFPSNMTISTGAARAPAGAHIHCWHERLRGGGGATGAAVRTRECAWNSTGAAVPLNVFGEARVRFQINDMYPHYHDAEQLLHSSDLMLQHTWRRRCPRQLACMQRLLRAHALRRRHFDGSPVAWGTYTAGDDEWAAFGGRRGPSDAECEAVLALPPERCGEGMAGERSARSCEELRAAPLPPLSEAAVALDADEAGAALSVAAAPPIQCAAERGDCREARCCQDADARCYGTLLEMAKCLRVRCIADNIWSCDVLPPPRGGGGGTESAAAGRPTWAAAAGGGCGEQGGRGGGCVGAVTHGAAVSACRAVGARLCAELRAGRAAGSGCDAGAARLERDRVRRRRRPLRSLVARRRRRCARAEAASRPLLCGRGGALAAAVAPVSPVAAVAAALAAHGNAAVTQGDGMRRRLSRLLALKVLHPCRPPLLRDTRGKSVRAVPAARLRQARVVVPRHHGRQPDDR